MDKESLVSMAPLGCATIGVCAGLGVFALHPDQGPQIKDFVETLLVLCGTAWQASRTQKQPGA